MLFSSWITSLAASAAAAAAAAVGPTANGGTYTPLPSIPIAPRQEHSTVRITPSTIAIVGGIIPDANGDGGFETTTLVQIYNATSQTWTRAADLPVALNHPNVAAINGKIYVLGGLTPAEEGVWRATGSSWEYTPDSDEWRALPCVPAGYEAGSAAMGVHGQTIILAGGMRLLSHVREGVQDTVDFVHAFDLSKGVWKGVPQRARTLPEGRDHAGAAVVNGTMYILGGRFRGQDNVKDTVFALDLGCNIARGWSVRGARMPTARGGVAAAAVDGVVYTFGGEGNKEAGSMGVFPQAEAYDVDKDEWTRLRNMTNPRHGTYAAPLGGGVVIPGGGDRQGGAPMDLVEVFYP